MMMAILERGGVNLLSLSQNLRKNLKTSPTPKPIIKNQAKMMSGNADFNCQFFNLKAQS